MLHNRMEVVVGGDAGPRAAFPPIEPARNNGRGAHHLSNDEGHDARVAPVPPVHQIVVVEVVPADENHVGLQLLQHDEHRPLVVLVEFVDVNRVGAVRARQEESVMVR